MKPQAETPPSLVGCIQALKTQAFGGVSRLNIPRICTFFSSHMITASFWPLALFTGSFSSFLTGPPSPAWCPSPSTLPPGYCFKTQTKHIVPLFKVRQCLPTALGVEMRTLSSVSTALPGLVSAFLSRFVSSKFVAYTFTPAFSPDLWVSDFRYDLLLVIKVLSFSTSH